MTFFDELYEKVNDLRDAFKQSYAGEFGFVVQRDGGMAVSEQTAPEYDARKVAECEAFLFEVEMLCSRFMGYAHLDRAPYRQLIDDLGAGNDSGEGAPISSAFGRLDRTVNIEHMGGIVGLVDGDEWCSPAAQVFEAWAKTFGSTLRSQRMALHELVVLTEMYHQAVIHVQRDLKALVDNGTEVLHGPEVKVDFFGAVSLIADAIGIVVFPELEIPFAIDAAGGVAGFISTLTTAEDPVQTGEYRISGGGTWEIFESISGALDRLQEAVEASDRTINDTLEQALTSPDSLANTQLDLPPPSVAATADFGRMWLTYDPSIPIEHDQVVVTLVDLYEAAHRHIPRTASLYTLARISIADIDVPLLEYRRHWWHSHDNAIRLVDRLVEIFNHSHDTLIDVADALAQIADGYVLTDLETEEYNRQVEMRFPSVQTGAPPHSRAY